MDFFLNCGAQMDTVLSVFGGPLPPRPNVFRNVSPRLPSSEERISLHTDADTGSFIQEWKAL